MSFGGFKNSFSDNVTDVSDSLAMETLEGDFNLSNQVQFATKFKHSRGTVKVNSSLKTSGTEQETASYSLDNDSAIEVDFPRFQTVVQTKLKSKAGQIQADFGRRVVNNNISVHPYFKLNYKNDFTGVIPGFGAVVLFKKCVRGHLFANVDGSKKSTVFSKILVDKDNFQFGFANSFNANKLERVASSCMVAYEHKGVEVTGEW